MNRQGKSFRTCRELYENEKMSKATDTKEGDIPPEGHLFQIEFENAVFSIELHKALKILKHFFKNWLLRQTQPQRALRMTAPKKKRRKEKMVVLGLIISF